MNLFNWPWMLGSDKKYNLCLIDSWSAQNLNCEILIVFHIHSVMGTVSSFLWISSMYSSVLKCTQKPPNRLILVPDWLLGSVRHLGSFFSFSLLPKTMLFWVLKKGKKLINKTEHAICRNHLEEDIKNKNKTQIQSRLRFAETT